MSKNRRNQQPEEALSRFLDPETEALILGGILAGGEPVYRTVSFLTVDDFTLERHQIIFRAIAQIALEVHPDLTGVAYHLDATGRLDAVGGLSALADIHAKAIPDLGLSHFGSKLRRKTLDRRAFKLSEKLSALCAQGFAANSTEILSTSEELRTISETAFADEAGGVQSIRPVREYGDTQMRCVVEGLLYEGTFNLLTGDSGHGKSTLALVIAAAVAGSLDFAGRKTSARPVAILDRENPQGVIHERLDRLCIQDGEYLKIWGGWCAKPAPGPDDPELLAWIRMCDVKPLIFFDSLISFFTGQSENDSTEARRYTDSFRRLAHLGCTIVCIHHTGKGETSRDYRGSSDFKAACDCAWHVSNSGNGKLETLQVRPWKSRFTSLEKLVFHYSDGRFTEGTRSLSPTRTVNEQLTELLKAKPEIKSGAFVKLALERGLGRDRARDFLDQGVKHGTIRRVDGRHNSQMYTWIGLEEGE